MKRELILISIFSYDRNTRQRHKNHRIRIHKIETFDCIRGIQLVATITNGKQRLIIQHKKQSTRRIRRGNKWTNATVYSYQTLYNIKCIHTAICEISTEDLVSNQDSELEAADLFEETLKIRSSEGIRRRIKLSPEDQWFAFRSWVAGIASTAPFRSHH